MNIDNAVRPLRTELPEQVQSAIANNRVVLVVSPITELGLVTRWLSQQGQDYCRVELSMRSPAARASYEKLRRATRCSSLPQIFIDGQFIGGTEQFFDAVEQGGERTSTAKEHSTPARWLGYGGLIPFFALSLLTLIGSEAVSGWANQALMAYGAVILSFVGALHWTRGLDAGNSSDAARLLSVSVIPALLAWTALLLPAHAGLLLLAAGFGLLYAYDRTAWRLSPWFLSLRSHLTAGAVGSLMVVWLGSAA